MGYPKDYKGSHVAMFDFNDDMYQHVIHCNTDDRVECLNDLKEVVLTFTATSDVFIGPVKDRNKLGRLQMNRDYTWSLLYGEDYAKRLDSEFQDVLEFEVEISKAYLNGELS